MTTALDWAWLGRKALLADSFCWLAATPPVTELLGKRLRVAPFPKPEFPMATCGAQRTIPCDMLKETYQ
jgi:hypothetical protein